MPFPRPLPVFLSSLLLSVCQVAYAAPGKWLSELGPLSLKWEQGAALFKQCSRSAPVPDGPLWQPERAQLQQLQRDLQEYLQKTPTAAANLIKDGKYRGQFIGFIRGGQRLIYASFAAGFAVQEEGNGEALIVCDGGNAFWGIVYHPAKRQFSELKVNGAI